MESFLRAPIYDKQGKNYTNTVVGIPQGYNKLSPVLMNVYLDKLYLQKRERVS
jgi:hypothetical protein